MHEAKIQKRRTQKGTRQHKKCTRQKIQKMHLEHINEQGTRYNKKLEKCTEHNSETEKQKATTIVQS